MIGVTPDKFLDTESQRDTKLIINEKSVENGHILRPGGCDDRLDNIAQLYVHEKAICIAVQDKCDLFGSIIPRVYTLHIIPIVAYF